MISITDFLKHRNEYTLLDVRTPQEYEKGHIPGATNLAIFSNEERVKIGTTYKQVGREEAILLGLELTGSKWRNFVEQALKIAPDKKVCVHCWRGGMRSKAMAWVLDFYGFEVKIIEGGYKAFRNWVLQQFEKKYSFVVLGGMTGSHKTEILLALRALGTQIIDLEGLAQHQGSTFGSLNRLIQPSQEYFENQLAFELFQFEKNNEIWIEDESLLIGKIIIPKNIFKQIRDSIVIQISLPKEERVQFLTKEYGSLSKDFLIERTLQIQKRLGPQNAKVAVEAIKENRMETFVTILLTYYDKTYTRGLSKRNPNTIYPIMTNFIDARQSAGTIYKFYQTILSNEKGNN